MNLPQDHSQLSSACLAGSLYSQYMSVWISDCHGGSTNIVERSILLQKPVGVLITRFQTIGWAILCSECALLMPFHPDTFNSDQSHTQHQQPKTFAVHRSYGDGWWNRPPDDNTAILIWSIRKFTGNHVFVCLDQAIFKPLAWISHPKTNRGTIVIGFDVSFGGLSTNPQSHDPSHWKHFFASWAGPPCGFLRLEGAVGMVAERDIQARKKLGMVAR